MAKLHALDNDARFAPVKCLNRVLEDIAEGKFKPRRIVIVAEDEAAGLLSIRAAGVGMDYVPTVIGLLVLAEDDLAQLVRTKANGEG